MTSTVDESATQDESFSSSEDDDSLIDVETYPYCAEIDIRSLLKQQKIDEDIGSYLETLSTMKLRDDQFAKLLDNNKENGYHIIYSQMIWDNVPDEVLKERAKDIEYIDNILVCRSLFGIAQLRIVDYLIRMGLLDNNEVLDEARSEYVSVCRYFINKRKTSTMKELCRKYGDEDKELARNNVALFVDPVIALYKQVISDIDAAISTDAAMAS